MRTKLRLSILAALFLSISTGVVMASSTACQIAAVEQLRSAQAAVHKRVHHSTATLARWKIGAAAWSKAHGGKVYAGMPTPRRQDWIPHRFNCDDVALDLSRPDEGLLLPSETMPEFAGHWGTPSRTGLDLTAATVPPAEDTWEQAAASIVPTPFGESPGFGGGSAPDAPVGSASFPPAPVYPPLASPIPAPESPTIVLLGTGMLSFLVTRLRRRTVV